MAERSILREREQRRKRDILRKIKDNKDNLCVKEMRKEREKILRSEKSTKIPNERKRKERKGKYFEKEKRGGRDILREREKVEEK